MTGSKTATRAASRTRRSGFTLMELMAVVGIVVLMASMVVGGFAGIQRAMGTSTGADRFRRALGAARQQACVDGTDVFVWCIGMDKFVVCRKGGTVSGKQTSKYKRTPKYTSGEEVEAYWVCDEFAEGGEDVSTAYINRVHLDGNHGKDTIGTLKIPGGGDITIKGKDLSQFFRQEFSELMVFDVTAGKMATCSYPPFYDAKDKAYEGMMFGIKDSDYDKGTFTLGHAYAWPLMPVQTLPGGFVFDKSWKSDGELDPDWMQKAYVHFYPDGRAKCGLGSSGFTITEAGAAKPMVQKVKIDGNGFVTVTSK